MVEQNLVDRELCLEAMRRGLVSKEGLIPYAQRKRSDPNRSLAGLLIEAGVFTPELGIEIERLARTRAEALSGGAPPPPPPPPPPVRGPAASGSAAMGANVTGANGSGRPGATPAGGTRIASASGKFPVPPAANKNIGTTSGRHNLPGKVGSGSSVSLQLPQHTFMDLDSDGSAPTGANPVASPTPTPSGKTPSLKPGDSRAPGVNPAEFRASRTYVDGDNGTNGRTMIEDDFVAPSDDQPLRTMIAEDGFAGENGAPPQNTMIAEDGFAGENGGAQPLNTMIADDGFGGPTAPPQHTLIAEDGFSSHVPSNPPTPAPPASTRGSAAASTTGASPSSSTTGAGASRSPISSRIGPSSSRVPQAPGDSAKRAVASGAHRSSARISKAADTGRISIGGAFGDYEITGKLGEGAMGQVYKAKRTTDGLVVALKVMRGGLVANPKVRERFLREAKAAKMIDHVNVVRFIDAGMNGNDQFLAMEFVEGRSLQSVLSERKGKPLEFDKAAELFRQICDGLAAAHEAGVIHRDLKPENVLVTKDGEVCKITDFGLARREEESMLLTRPGQVMGSPYYMAPEQGMGLPVDHRADIYSLGAILFCFFTGRVPFPFPSATEVIHAHCHAERPDPREANPEVPTELAAFMLKVLAREPENRPQTVRAVVQEFDEVYERELNPSVVPSQSKLPQDEPDDEDSEGALATQQVVDALPLGTRLGALTIQSVIGAGGMGAVYRAVHDTGRISALKVLPRQLATDPKRMEAFLREGHLGARIAHPNVVETREYGFDAPMGMAYLEVELLEGTSLENLIKTGVLQDESLIVAIARGVAQALDGVHAAGILHRDIKPANVLLGADFLSRPDGSVKLIDFGLAIEKKDVITSGNSQFAGTPMYMAPEQAHQDGIVDERSDIYSLGATLYHAACGKPPFDGKTPAAISYQHQKTQPKPARQHNPTLSEAFEILVQILLSKSQDERFQSAKELLAELARTTPDGKLAKPQVHAKYRTNRLGKNMEGFKIEKEAPEAPPPRAAIIGAAAVVLLCALVILFQIGRAVLSHSAQQETPPTPAPVVVTPVEPVAAPTPPPVERPDDRDNHAKREAKIKQIETAMDENRFLDARRLIDKAVREDGTLENRIAHMRPQLDAAVKCFEEDLLEARRLSLQKHYKESNDKLGTAATWISREDDQERLDKLTAELKDGRRGH